MDVCFSFRRNGNRETDLPRGIGIEEREIYSLAKGYFFAKVSVSAECLQKFWEAAVFHAGDAGRDELSGMHITIWHGIF